MLYWSAVFFLIAIVAGFFGFSGVADAASGIAQFLFVTFLVVAGAFLAAGVWATRKARKLLR